ncbi:nitroreductase family protein [Amycolatopsis sp. GM8]|uniref:nitroreductase family protein n=1 Tax=Amycolatopsis sp. GM8 TaxID=2896530 RepID=UPI001F321135|nr:nitroreductase family protein [Amycolatopsis sp. GM8]
MDLFEAMETCRSIRRLKPDPVPDEMLERLVYYATRAASAGNSQLWRFIIVTDPGDRRWFRDMLATALAPTLGDGPPADDDHSLAARNQRMYRRFVLEFDKIPAFILTAVENAFPSAEKPDPHYMWSSVFTATQNLLLAARGMGLGAAMTTNHLANEPAVREHFGIPATVELGATIPIGFPEGRYGPVTRQPVSEVIYRDRWGKM